ncbi:MAG: hypothetical protein JW774_04460 [Candidatus Aureabacteria bacterium]|nr:hypothetical protein [Candidatus Auribacterota bacterium]
MNVINKSLSHLVLVFSPSGKLVSHSLDSQDFHINGEPFASLFEGGASLFDTLSRNETSVPGPILFLPAEKHYIYIPHLLKDPSGTTLALIMTLIPDTSLQEDSAFPDERMIRMDRLAQVGQLAASLAHEIRNPLAGISANVQVLAGTSPKNDPNQKTYAMVLEEVARMEKIMKDLLDYARQSQPHMESISLPVLFEKIKCLISAQLNKQNIKLAMEIQEDLRVRGDPGQLIQVCLNLILNASGAMPKGGEIRIQSEKTPVAVKIIFKDSGCGMNEETLFKIFDPFFTTKAKGLGLGLTIAKKIMDDHAGSMEAWSRPGQGTVITLSFPIKKI